MDLAALRLPASQRVIAAFLAVLRAGRNHNVTITRMKLAKLLYMADIRAIKDARDPISGVQWQWLYFGPYHNDLMHLENALVDAGVVQRTPYFSSTGFVLQLARSIPGYDMPPEDRERLDATVADLGRYAATSLKDLSYQTAPMLDAQQHGHHGVAINLELARPVPDLAPAAARLSAVLASLPAQEDDEGVAEDLLEEHESFADARARANEVALGDASS